MQKRICIFAIYITILCGCLLNCKQTEALHEGPPNVILIVVDDLGYKDLAFMGSDYYETPNLDRLASQGMIFTQAYASASNCAPSRACMLSGLQTTKHGVYTVGNSERGKAKIRKLIPTKNTKHLNNEVYTLLDMFKTREYVTGSFGKWHVGPDPSLQGVDINVGGSDRGNPSKGGYFSPYKIDNIKNGPDGEYLTDRLTNEAIKFLSENQDTSFFLYMPFYTVHTPIMAKEELLEKFRIKKGSNGQSNPAYAAMVYSMDQNVGRLLNKLEELDLEEETLIVFTSDNGGIRAISDQEPLRAGKGSYYEGGIRVPLLAKWPGKIQPGSKNHTRVSNIDFFPTFQQIIQADSTITKLDGVDISPLFKGGEIAKRDLLWHFPIYLQAYDENLDDGRDPLFRTRPGTVLISDDWKLHEYFEDGALELYDLKNDQGERNNLVEVEKVRAEKMHEAMKEWRLKMNAPVPTEANPSYEADFEKALIEAK